MGGVVGLRASAPPPPPPGAKRMLGEYSWVGVPRISIGDDG